MANKIVQFTNASGDNVYPLAYAQGGMKMDLLWTNSNTDANFTPQTVSLDMTPYELFLVSCVAKGGSRNDIGYGICKIGSYGTSYCGFTGSPWHINYEITSSGFRFINDYNASGSAGNGSGVIPYQIYGIKMSYITPTEVHGLTYQED